MGRLLTFFLVLGLPGLVAGVVTLFWFATTKLPSVEDAQQLTFSQSTVIYDRKALEENANLPEHILYVIHGDENRNYVPLSAMSPWVEKATLAIEDDTFYSHWGFDLGGLFKAVLSELGVGPTRGGSTITQQLIKNTFLSNERTWTRKFKEILLAVKMEGKYEKEDILELYLNKIPYGNNAFGIEAAAQTYFSKTAKDLTILESAVLASLPVAPSRFNPYREDKTLLMGFEKDGEWKKGRKDLVLDRMLALEMITEDEHATAVEEGKTLAFKRAVEDIEAPHFVMHVKQLVADKYGDEILETGGLRIFTTLHPEMQTVAENVVAERTKEYYTGFRASNASLAAINPQNGEVLAYIGGKDYFAEDFDGQVDVLQRSRQPGSAFKPFVFAAAFEKGYYPATSLFDVETDFGNDYKPQNYDGEFTGPVSARKALNASLNIPAIKMAQLAGGDKEIIAYSQKTGVQFTQPEVNHGVAIGVGSAEVKPISLIGGYQSFVNEGPSFAPQYILEIQDSEGHVLEKYNPEENKLVGVPNAGVALTRNIITDAESRPSRWNRLLQLPGFENGAKTGTTNREDEPSDSWTLGFTPHLVSGVWVGNNSGRTMVGGATGLKMAAPIWNDFNVQAHEILVREGADPEKGYPTNITLVPKTVNKFSGALASESTPEHLRVTDFFAPELIPENTDKSIIGITIDRISKKEATDATPEYLREPGRKLVLKSRNSKNPDWENPVQAWQRSNSAFGLTLGRSYGVLKTPPEEELAVLYAEAELAHLRETNPFAGTEEDPNTLDFPDAVPPTNTNNTTSSSSGSIIPKTVNKPSTKAGISLKIVEPQDNMTLETPNLSVRLNPRARDGINSVILFLNDTPVRQMTVGPWQTELDATPQMMRGVPFQLRAVLTSNNGEVIEQSVRVRPVRGWKPPRDSNLSF